MKNKLKKCRYFLVNIFLLLLFINNSEIIVSYGVESSLINTWKELAQMPGSLLSPSAVAYNDKIYVMGGSESTSFSSGLNTFYAYDINSNRWETLAPMPTARAQFDAYVIDDKIYCIGGTDNVGINDVDIYDFTTGQWTKGASMPESRGNYVSVVIDKKIYIFGGKETKVRTTTIQVYDTVTDTWEKKADAPEGTVLDGDYTAIVERKGDLIYFGDNNSREGKPLKELNIYNTQTEEWSKTNLSVEHYYELSETKAINNTLFVFGGREDVNGDSYGVTPHVKKYDIKANTWISLSMAPNPLIYFDVVYYKEIFYIIGGNFTKNKILAYYPEIPPEEPGESTPEENDEKKCEEAVVKAEESRNPEDIEAARELVNALPESIKKDDFQNRLDELLPNIEFETKNSTANFDVYIKSENLLSLSLNTNNITFEDFSGVENVEKLNALTLTVNSSLPYQVNAYLPNEITGSRFGETLDKGIFNIRASGKEYQTFSDTETPILLLDNETEGNEKSHNIDLMLKGELAHKKDIYKATIKFEIQQK